MEQPGADPQTAAAEIERLRSEHRHVSNLLLFLQELSSTITTARTVADVFGAAFQKLSGTVPFDIGAAVMLEQNLNVHLTKRPSHEKAVDERFIKAVRATLQRLIPVSFVSTDAVIQSDFSTLPEGSSHSDDPLRFEAHTILREEQRTAGILVLYRGDSEFRPEEQGMLEVLASQVSMVLGNIHAQEQIQNLADTDDLTGIWNRRYLRRQLPAEVERATIYNVPLSLLLFDVDDFKAINDEHGHTMGDVVLSELCGSVRETLRPPDLFARYGGDEMAIILPHTDLTGAVAVAERIMDHVREIRIPTGEGDQSISCSVSLGVATLIPPDMSATELMNKADEMLYLSKRNGKNRFSF